MLSRLRFTHGCVIQAIFAPPLFPFWNVAVIPTPPEPSWGHWPGSAVAETRFLLEWLNALWEWPRSRSVVEQIAACLAEQKSSGQAHGPVRFCWPGLILRNLLFLAVVLVHGFRRLLPPY